MRSRILLVLGTLFAGQGLASTWKIDDAHTEAGFSVRHMMVSNTKGRIGGVEGTVVLDDKDVTKSTVEVSLDVKTINTNEPKRDDHLRSPDFFDVQKYPKMTFVSTKVEKVDANNLKVTGKLTIKDKTNVVVLKVEGPTAAHKDPWGNIRRGISATTEINRKDYGLTWNKALETGGVVVGDQVKISIDAELMEQTPAAKTAPAKK
jgi:polyisoprenoid-binding protein YceI